MPLRIGQLDLREGLCHRCLLRLVGWLGGGAGQGRRPGVGGEPTELYGHVLSRSSYGLRVVELDRRIAHR